MGDYMRQHRLQTATFFARQTWYRPFRAAQPWLAAVVVSLTAACASVHALTPISQSYATADKLPLGAIVGLKDNTADQVEAANSSTADGIIGVVINADTSLLSLTNGKSDQVQVATSGTTPVLVSDINGPITKGDHITASPIAGVGMKATDNVRIVGIAQSDLTGATEESYKDKQGAAHTVHIGQVPVLVNVSYYFKEPDKTIIPSALQNVANALAGKNVSALPIIISAAIFVITIIIVASIAYSMIRSSIISVGRNPMSQSAIYRDLIQMSALDLGILAVGLIAIYLVLTRL